jgi:hypothetical protein
MHPGIEGLRVAEFAQRAKDIDGDFLSDVGGILAIWHQRRCGAQGHAERASGERLARVALTRTKGSHLIGDQSSRLSRL